MSVLFSPAKIGALEIKNRFVRSATHDYTSAPDGTISDRSLKIYRELAAGEVGLIITGHAFIDDKGIPSAGMIGIDSDEKIAGMKKITKTVHDNGGTIFVQLNHGGRNTRPDFAKGDIVAPSSVPNRVFRNRSRELTEDEIEDLIQKFVLATVRAREAGFDGVQFHAAHGYLISQFHSPFTNKRADRFGGSLENRTRFLREIVQRARRIHGGGYPLIVKLNSRDFVRDGLNLDESAWIAGMSEGWGLDAVEVSGGVYETSGKISQREIDSLDREGYFREAAQEYKKVADIPIILVGGFRSLNLMEEVVREGTADIVSLSRPLIMEPDLVKKFKEGAKTKADCASCSGCLDLKSDYLKCVRLKGEAHG